MLAGARALAGGVVQGVAGVVARPVEGAEARGFSGFLEGMAKVK